MEVFESIAVRRSTRAYLPKPVPQETIQEIIAAAGQAPSAINLQPWEFTVVSGEERPRLSRALAKAYKERGFGCGTGSSKPMPESLKARQSSIFSAMSRLLDAGPRETGDFVNVGSLDFYGAPVAVIITMDSYFAPHFLTSAGIMIGWMLLAAEAKGLATCPIGLISAYEETVLDTLNLNGRRLVLGVAVGYADPDAPVNRLATTREPVENLVRWYGV